MKEIIPPIYSKENGSRKQCFVLLYTLMYVCGRRKTGKETHEKEGTELKTCSV